MIYDGIRQVLRLDSWRNVFTGRGTSQDRTQHSHYHGGKTISDYELSALYHGDDTAQRIIATKPNEMVRAGYTINVEGDVEGAAALMGYAQDLNALTGFRDALIWGRLFGGCVIYVGAEDGLDPSQPLDESAIKTISFLHVIDRRELSIYRYYTDPTRDCAFGEPESYQVTPLNGGKYQVIHHSRLIRFGGAHTSRSERTRLNGWDHSIIHRLYGPLRQFNTAWAASETMIDVGSQPVFKIQGLLEAIAGGHKEAVSNRMAMVNMMRSNMRALVLDTNEAFEQVAAAFGDAATLLDKFMLRLASAAEMPATILMGQSPAGMNATGASDFRWWYDSIATAQNTIMRPRLMALLRLCMLAGDSPMAGVLPDQWGIHFEPLWRPTPSEDAALQKATAERDQIYLQSGVLLPEEVAASRFPAGGWSPETTIDHELRARSIAYERELMANGPTT